MTLPDLHTAATRAVESFIGSTARSLMLTAAVAGIGWILKTTNDHSTELAGLRSDVRGFTTTISGRVDSLDRQVGQMNEVQTLLREEIARLQAEDGMRDRDLGRVMPRRTEPN